MPDADRLKVHAEDRGNAGVGRTGALQARHLVQNRGDLQGVVTLDAVETRRRIGAGQAVVGIDFRREEIVHAMARRPIQDLVGRMLVRPGRVTAVGLDDLEDRVGLDELVGQHGGAFAITQGERQQRVIDLRQGIAERPTTRVGQGVLIEMFVEGRLRAGRARAIRACGKQGPVVGDVIEDAMGLRGAAGDLGQKAGERIGGGRRQSVRIDRPVTRQRSKGAFLMRGDIGLQVRGMHAIDADEKNTRDIVMVFTECRCRCCKCKGHNANTS